MRTSDFQLRIVPRHRAECSIIQAEYADGRRIVHRHAWDYILGEWVSFNELAWLYDCEISEIWNVKYFNQFKAVNWNLTEEGYKLWTEREKEVEWVEDPTFQRRPDPHCVPFPFSKAEFSSLFLKNDRGAPGTRSMLDTELYEKTYKKRMILQDEEKNERDNLESLRQIDIAMGREPRPDPAPQYGRGMRDSKPSKKDQDDIPVSYVRTRPKKAKAPPTLETPKETTQAPVLTSLPQSQRGQKRKADTTQQSSRDLEATRHVANDMPPPPLPKKKRVVKESSITAPATVPLPDLNHAPVQQPETSRIATPAVTSMDGTTDRRPQRKRKITANAQEIMKNGRWSKKV